MYISEYDPQILNPIPNTHRPLKRALWSTSRLDGHAVNVWHLLHLPHGRTCCRITDAKLRTATIYSVEIALQRIQVIVDMVESIANIDISNG